MFSYTVSAVGWSVRVIRNSLMDSRCLLYFNAAIGTLLSPVITIMVIDIIIKQYCICQENYRIIFNKSFVWFLKNVLNRKFSYPISKAMQIPAHLTTHSAKN
jgi:hypothetical protein